MGTTSKFIYSSVLAILVILMFLIFYMQKSAQLSMDVQDNHSTIEKKDLIIANIQQKLKDTSELASSASDKNQQIPELTEKLTSIEKEKTAYLQQVDALQARLKDQTTVASDRLSELTALQSEYNGHQQLLVQKEAHSLKLTDVITVLQEDLALKNELLSQSSQAIEEKDQAISFYTERLAATEDIIKSVQTESSIKAMNLSLILDELALKTQLVVKLQERLEQLGSDDIQKGSSISAVSEIQAIMTQLEQKSLNPAANSELPGAKAQIQELKIIIAGLQADINEQSARIQDLKSQLQEKDQTLVLEQDKLLQQEMNNQALSSELELNLQQGQEALVPLTEEIAALEIQLATALDNNTQLTDTVSKSGVLLVELQTANETLSNELNSATEALEATLSELTQVSSGMEAVAATQQQGEDARIALATETEELKLALSQAEQNQTVLSDQYTALETEFKNLAEKQAASDASQLEFENQLTAAGTALQTSQEQTDTLQSEIVQLTAVVAEKDQINQDLSDKISANAEQLSQETDLGQQVAVLTSELAAALSVSDQQAAIVAEKDSGIQDITAQLASNEQELTATKAALAQATANQTEAADNSAAREQENAAQAEEAAAAKAVNDEQAAQLIATREQLIGIEANLEEMDKALADSQTQLSQGKEEIAVLTASLASLTAERDQLLLRSTDTDKDGISDADDTCPETVEGAKVDAKGCEEDSDSDGLVNRLDLCPDTASGANTDAAGCAEDQTTVVLEGISFQFGTAELADDASSSLDIAANILVNSPDIRMEIAGHTDSIGDTNANLHLSALRAESVLTYLVSKGVPADRLQAKGYGADEPIADNSDKIGRAKNRRVELRRIDAPMETEATEVAPASSTESDAGTE